MGASARLQARTVAEARDGLQRVLGAIRAGELTAGPGYVARLEGAVAALDALLPEPNGIGRDEWPGPKALTLRPERANLAQLRGRRKGR